MIKPLSLGSIVVFLVLTSCTVFESPEVVHDVLLKELPNKTWLTTKIPMNSGIEYTSLVKAGLVQPINNHSNKIFYKVTDVGWPFVVNYQEGDYQGYGEAEVMSHYITDYKVIKMDFVGTEEITAHVDIVYAVTEFLADSLEARMPLASINPSTELCYSANYTRTSKIKLKKYDDGWHIDRDSKDAIEKFVQGTDSLKRNATLDSTTVCFPYAGVRIQSYLVYDDDNSLSAHDPIKELDFSGDKPHSRAKIVITGNFSNVSLLITESQNENRVLINTKFNLAGSAEYIFPTECEQIKIDLRTSDGKILYQDFMNFGCGD